MDDQQQTSTASATGSVSRSSTQGATVHNPYNQSRSSTPNPSSITCPTTPQTNTGNHSANQILNQSPNHGTGITVTPNSNNQAIGGILRNSDTTTPETRNVRFNLNINSTQKSGKKGMNVSMAKTYLEGVAATLPSTLGSFCKETAETLLKLTDQITSRRSVSLKLNSDDPSTLPRSLRVKIELRAPANQRETPEYKELAEQLEKNSTKLSRKMYTYFQKEQWKHGKIIGG